MKFTVPVLKPRNPLVALARTRLAGSHHAKPGALRQQAGRDLQRELRSLDPHLQRSP